MKTRTRKLALAAAVILIVLGGITFWPFGHSGKSQWWLGSSAAWGQELLATLDTIKAVTCREQTVFVAADGSQHTSSTWDRFYVSKRQLPPGHLRRQRRCVRSSGTCPTATTWFSTISDSTCDAMGLPGTAGASASRTPSRGCDSTSDRMDKADRLLEEQVIDGRTCVGFEIRASQYGDNPETWIDRIWFDVETKLPVRIEQSGRPVTGDATRTFTTIQDQFDLRPAAPGGHVHPAGTPGRLRQRPSG